MFYAVSISTFSNGWTALYSSADVRLRAEAVAPEVRLIGATSPGQATHQNVNFALADQM